MCLQPAPACNRYVKYFFMISLLYYQLLELITNYIFNNEFITTLAQVGTFISAIISLYTLREVKKQRLVTYRPELFIKSFCIIPTFNPLFNRTKMLEYKA